MEETNRRIEDILIGIDSIEDTDIKGIMHSIVSTVSGYIEKYHKGFEGMLTNVDIVNDIDSLLISIVEYIFDESNRERFIELAGSFQRFLTNLDRVYINTGGFSNVKIGELESQAEASLLLPSSGEGDSNKVSEVIPRSDLEIANDIKGILPRSNLEIANDIKGKIETSNDIERDKDLMKISMILSNIRRKNGKVSTLQGEFDRLRTKYLGGIKSSISGSKRVSPKGGNVTPRVMNDLDVVYNNLRDVINKPTSNKEKVDREWEDISRIYGTRGSLDNNGIKSLMDKIKSLSDFIRFNRLDMKHKLGSTIRVDRNKKQEPTVSNPPTPPKEQDWKSAIDTFDSEYDDLRENFKKIIKINFYSP